MPASYLNSILLPLVAILTTLITLAVFDFYAFSPRPSGLAKRSRELAPVLAIVLSFVIAALSLHLRLNLEPGLLVLNGANDAAHTLQNERLRLLTYPLVATSVFESVLLGLALLTSAYFLVSKFGLLGWCVIVISTITFTGVFAVLSHPTGTNFGPFEVVIGLAFASTYVASRDRALERNSKIDLGLVALLFFAAAIAGVLTESPLRLELLIAAALTGAAGAAFLLQLTRLTGPHWESTSLFFVSGLSVFVIVGFTMALSPAAFDPVEWRHEVTRSRIAIQTDLETSMRPIENNPEVYPEVEIAFAERVASGATRLRYLAARAENKKLAPRELESLREIKSLEQMLRILERLHVARALVADVERRATAARVVVPEPNRADPMGEFWRTSRPWIFSQLQTIKADGLKSSEAQAFAASVELDLDRLTAAAIAVEIHRVDAWVDWAARQPRELLPLIKQTATAQMAKLDELSTIAQPDALKPESRFNSLHRNLRKMASVPEEKWE